MSWITTIAWGSDTARLLGAAATLLLYGAMCGGIWRRTRLGRARARVDAAHLAPSIEGGAPWLVAYASQTGTAEQLAWQTAQALHGAGLAAQVVALSDVTTQLLASTSRALFIVSTYGEGDPPDNAAPFARVMSDQPTADLGGLQFAVLALGDREYRHFCGFGRLLDAWLREAGAQPLFDRTDVDNHDPAALAQWRRHLNGLGAEADATDWDAPPFESWELTSRRHLNPGSTGAPTFEVELQPMHGRPTWQSGDLVQVLAPADPDRARDYSIASLPSEGSLRLLIRQERHGDGQLGVASGWLTEQAPVGTDVPLRLRPHKNFQLGGNTSCPLILVGNGTGLAGLRGHLKTRADAMASGGPRTRQWLVFGERQRSHDLYWGDELLAWHRSGVLERLDLAFSRDGPQKLYVQDLLDSRAGELREWVEAGAAIYVCGSLQGMASGVHTVLAEALGASALEGLQAEGRYRRDVY